jgi:hypothetical protein
MVCKKCYRISKKLTQVTLTIAISQILINIDKKTNNRKKGKEEEKKE